MKTPIVHDWQFNGQTLRRILWLASILLLLWASGQMVFSRGTLIPVDNLFQFAPYNASSQELGVGKPHIPLYSDLILQNYPWWQFIRQSLQEGQLPLWNPYTFSGTPFLAKGQHMALYPLSLPFYLMPLKQAYGFFVVIHLWLAAFSAAFLARTMGISRFGALVSGVVFGISGFMLARFVFPMIIAAAVWLPLVLAMAERIIIQYPYRGRPATLLWIILGGLAFGLQALVGHPEIFIYTLLSFTFYSLWRIVSQGLRQQKRSASSSRVVVLSSLAMMALIGLSIGAVQLLPQYLLLLENFRKEAANFSQILDWSYPWQHAITWLVPNYFGNPALYSYTDFFTGITETMPRPISWGAKNFVEGAMYVGILPLFLAFSGFLQYFSSHPQKCGDTGQPSSLLFSVLVVFSLCFAFGTPLYYLIYLLPGLEQIHSPFRWVMVSILGMAILAGYGIDRIRMSHRLAVIMGQISIISGCTLLFFIVLVRLFFEQLKTIIEAFFHYSGGSAAVFPSIEAFFSFEAPWFIQTAFMLLFAGLALRAMNRAGDNCSMGGNDYIWKPLVVLTIVVDLLLFGQHLYPEAKSALLQHTPEIIARMQKDTSLWRFSTFDPESKKIFPANAGWRHGIQDIRGYDSIFSLYYRNYMETIESQDELQYNRISPLRSLTALNSPLLDLLNVKYILSEKPITSLRYILEAHNEGLMLYRNIETMERAFTLPLSSTIIAEDPLEAMRHYDPRFHMILPTDGGNATNWGRDPLAVAKPGQPGVARIDHYQNNEITISVTAEKPLWLVLADSYDKGWSAVAWPVNSIGQRTVLPIERAYGTLRAVLLEKGDWVVRFLFRPVGIMPGFFLSLVAGGLSAIGLLLTYGSARKSGC